MIKSEKQKSMRLLQTKQAILPHKQWPHEQLKKFLIHNTTQWVKLSEKHDGKALMKMSVMKMQAHPYEDKDKELAKRLFDLLRKENDRVTQFQRREHAMLKQQRKGRVWSEDVELEDFTGCANEEWIKTNYFAVVLSVATILMRGKVWYWEYWAFLLGNSEQCIYGLKWCYIF